MESIINDTTNLHVLLLFLLATGCILIILSSSFFFVYAYKKHLSAFLGINTESLPLFGSGPASTIHINRISNNIFSFSDHEDNTFIPTSIIITQYVNLFFVCCLSVISSFSINFDISSGYFTLDQLGFVFFLSFAINFPQGIFRTYNLRQWLLIWYIIASICNAMTFILKIIYQIISPKPWYYIYSSDAAIIIVSLYFSTMMLLSCYSYYRYRILF